MDSSKPNVQMRQTKKVNFLSWLTFWWLKDIFWSGFKKELQPEDLNIDFVKNESEIFSARLESCWMKELECAENHAREPSLARAIFKTFRAQIILLTLFQAVLTNVIRMTPPILLSRIILYFSAESSMSREEVICYVVGLFVVQVVDSVGKNHRILQSSVLGMRMRVACCALVYNKLLRLSKSSLFETSAGQIVNIMSNDVVRLNTLPVDAVHIVACPLQVVLVTYLLYQNVGVMSTVGIGVLLLQSMPLLAVVSKSMAAVRSRIAVKTDSRVSLMSEIITGIQVIKMYAWEKPLALLVDAARRSEILDVSKASRLQAVYLCCIVMSVRLSLLASLTTHTLLGYTITAEMVFPLSSFLNVLSRTLLLEFGEGIYQVSESRVTLQRIQAFLLLEEKIEATSSSADQSRGSIVMRAATASWNNKAVATLTGVDLRVEPGELVAVVGAVGSGKSSLLLALSSELPLTSGSVSVTGTISYASQDAWLTADSIKNNILLGQKLDSYRYAEVLRVCDLLVDIRGWSSGDQTMVGERGVTLSGGQKARINLARAVYRQADVYLLDDPLSALDARVAKHVMQECIMGFLAGKSRVLVTHQTHLLQSALHVVDLDNGRIRGEGTYDSVLMKHSSLTHEEKEEGKENKSCETASYKPGVVCSTEDDVTSPQIAEEERAVGSISWQVYLEYFRFGGGTCLFAAMFGFLLLVLASYGGSDYWLSVWVNGITRVSEVGSRRSSDDNYYNYNNTSNMIDVIISDVVAINTNNVTDDEWNQWSAIEYNIGYGVVVGSALVSAVVLTLSLFSMSMRASINIHKAMFGRILRAPMFFFHTNPSGRILNRFSKDTGIVDEFLPTSLCEMIVSLTLTLSSLVLIVVLNLWLLIPVTVFLMLSFFLRQYYMNTAQTLKRLEGSTQSPVYTHVNESLLGITTIRVGQSQGIACSKFHKLQDDQSNVFFIFTASKIAFWCFLELAGVLLTGTIASIFIIFDYRDVGASVGLALSQSIDLNLFIVYGVTQSTKLVNQMTSVERVLQYSHVAIESRIEKLPPPQWPQRGCITFRGVSLRYSSEGETVLKNLTFTIPSARKVGIVGRTGAGKSSLIAALFRLAWQDGEVVIDGLDTSSISLESLRKSMSIIPQDPVLFSNTIRKNLDPLEEYQDEQLWDALEEVEMKQCFNSLSFLVEESGGNLSVGQRQLVCLARAILKDSTILVMDEATANVDPRTDELIQRTIRRRFKTCTVLTIAHRINTIVDSDLVMVLEGGAVVEFNHPHLLLLKKSGSMFWRLLQDTGAATAHHCTRVAQEAYSKSPISVEHLQEDVMATRL